MMFGNKVCKYEIWVVKVRIIIILYFERKKVRYFNSRDLRMEVRRNES